jgi:NADH-quinone oxidoreductase subunit C
MNTTLIEKITAAFPEAEHSVSLDWNVFKVDKADYYNLAKFLKEESDLDFNHLSDIFGVDYLEYLEIVCHMYSYKLGHKLRLKTRVTREDPEVDTLTSLWATANWHEREAWDLYGIVFKGHPNLKRILSDDDQPGHPYRKDVPLHNDEEYILSNDKPLAEYGLPEKWDW